MLRFCLLLASLLALAQRPNIILIMVDDRGFASFAGKDKKSAGSDSSKPVTSVLTYLEQSP